jgi:hypothetical protein
MAARTEDVHLHPPLPRWLVAPALGAVVAAIVALLRKRACEPALPRMSEAWLREHEVESSKDATLQ